MDNRTYGYFAFISYQRKDEETARWLHHQLEHYRLPVNIIETKPYLQDGLRPLFLDEAELAGGNLSEVIHNALSDSQFLIVLCSPNSAKSPWVNKEVQTFIQQGRADRIIPFILDGIPYSDHPDTECFPEALKKLRGTDKEQLGINMQAGQEIASVKLVAQMLGLSFDQLWQRYEREKREERRKLIEEKRRLQRLESRYLSEKAGDALVNGDSYLARLLALKALPADMTDPEDRPYIPEAEFIFRKACQSNSTILTGHSEGIPSIALSPDGKSLVSASWDGTIRIWNLDNGKEVKILNCHEGPVNTVCFNTDGTQILSASADGTVKVTDTESSKTIQSVDLCCKVGCAVFSPCGKFIASGSEDGAVCLWERETGGLYREFIGHTDWINSVRFSKCGTYAVSASDDGTVKLWDIGQETCLFTFTGHSGHVNTAEFSEDGRCILSASADGTIKIWDIRTGEVHRTFGGHCSEVTSAIYSHDNRHILSSSADNSIRLWDVETENLIRTWNGHKLHVYSCLFSNDERYVISSSWDHTIRLWDYHKDQPVELIPTGHEERLTCFMFCNNGQSVLTASDDHTIRLQDIGKGIETKVFAGHTDKVLYIALSPDGRHFASASEDKTLKLWDMETGEAVITFKGHCKPVWHVSFSPDGKLLLSASRDHTARIWDISTGMELGCMNGGSDMVYKVFHDSAHKEIIAITGSTVIVWDSSSLTLRKISRISCKDLDSAYITDYRDHRLLLADGCGHGCLMIWNMEKETLSQRIPHKHDTPINFACFTDDGKHIISAAHGGSIKISDAESGKDIYGFDSGCGSVGFLTLSPDGRFIAATGSDNMVHMFKYTPLQELIDRTAEHFHGMKLPDSFTE